MAIQWINEHAAGQEYAGVAKLVNVDEKAEQLSFFLPSSVREGYFYRVLISNYKSLERISGTCGCPMFKKLRSSPKMFCKLQNKTKTADHEAD